MPGTWTDPKTWVDGETPTGAQFNVNIRDNQRYLKDAPTFDGNVTVSGNINVAGSVTVPNLDATNLGITGNLLAAGNSQLGDAITDTVNIVGLITSAPIRNYTETRVDVAPSGGVLNLDCALGTYFNVNLTASCGVSLLNPPPTGRAVGITVAFFNQVGAVSVTWPGPVKWPSGLPPVMTATVGKLDVMTLLTYDAGAMWFGIIVGQNY